MRKRGTHFDDSFLIDKCSCKIAYTLPYDIFKVSAISLNFNLRFSKDRWTFLMVSGVTTSFGRPEHSASSVSTTTFKLCIPPTNGCFWWSWVPVALFKPLLSLHCFFSSKSNGKSWDAGFTRNLALLFLAGLTKFISYKIHLKIKYSLNDLLSASHPG